MPNWDTPTSRYALKRLLGTTVIKEIDDAQRAFADDLDAKMVGYSEGLAANRPTSTVGTPGVAGRHYRATDTGQIFIDTGTGWAEVLSSRGKSIIPTTETRTNVAYGLMPTPDRVQGIVLPTDGLIAVWYHALWHGGGAAASPRAAIFIGASQLRVPQDGVTTGVPGSQAGAIPDNVGDFANLVTTPIGLAGGTPAGSVASTVTTGQVVGAVPNLSGLDLLYALDGGAYTTLGDYTPSGGPCYLWAAAGTYDISVQFKSATGTITVKERKLWVRALPF